MGKLISHLPPLLKGYRELKIIDQTASEEIYTLIARIDELRDNGYIHTANEVGIKRFEELLDISGSEGLSLEERKHRVLSRYNEDIPYTFKALTRKLDILFGEGNYRATLFPSEYRLSIDIYALYESQLNEVLYFMSYMLPANMLLTLSVIRRAGQSLYLGYGVFIETIRKINIKPRRGLRVSSRLYICPATCRVKALKVNLHTKNNKRREHNDI